MSLRMLPDDDSHEAMIELTNGLGIPTADTIKREINRLRRLAGEEEPFSVDEESFVVWAP